MMVFPAKDKTSEVRSMLVMHQGALGDLILALPAIGTLRKAFPEATSVIMGYTRILELVEERFYADRILSIDQRGMATFFVRDGSLAPALSQFFSTFDLIVVFGRDEHGSILGNLEKVSQGRVLHIHSFPPWEEKTHLTDHLLKQFARYGFDPSESNPRLYLKEPDRDWARDFWRDKGLTMEERSRVIILHPGSGSKKKVWPLERFQNLARYLQEHLGGKILIVLGPAEGPEVQKIFEGMSLSAFFVAKGLSLLQMASVIEGCRLFIGNDSGISHMAAALGLPTLTIFGPTDPVVWSPRGENVWVVRREVPCSPCPQERFFLCKSFECLREIGIGEVLKGLERMGVGFKS